MTNLAPEWQFRELGGGEVELDPTQRDQFNNDDVGLADALVRESVQNSTDAANGSERVKVRFSLTSINDHECPKFKSLFSSLKPHLAATEIEDSQLENGDCQMLVIEDFNTVGLTGQPEELDNSHFRNFWRRHGKSGKSGKANGRWGLGKLVYSSASEIHAFFGLTFRDGDVNPLLMGQAVLLNHQIDDKRYPAHGFWFSDFGTDDIQLPVTDPEFTEEFSELTGLQRKNQPGLSLVIPFPRKNISETTLLSGVVENYYFPILAGKLVVEVGSQSLDQSNFLNAAAHLKTSHIPFEFVEKVSAKLDSDSALEVKTPLEESGLTEGHFLPEELDDLRKKYAEGQLVQLLVPVNLTRKDGESHTGEVSLFLQKPPENASPYALFVRGSLTIPGEQRYFSGIPAYGAMVASEEQTVSFLGDAENPAHTSWNPQSEKITANWRNAYKTMKGIRNSLRSLYGVLAGQIELTDPDALIDFFSLVDASPTTGKRKKKTPNPNPVVTPREKSLHVQPRKGGFAIVPGPGAASWSYPKTVRLRMAYDMIGGNPFKRFSKFDFDVAKGIEVDANSMEWTVVKPNVMQLTLESENFSLEATGFDINRDLVVEARAIG